MPKLQNRLLILVAFSAISGKSALTVQVTSVSQTQAVMIERGFSGPCTLVVSASNGGSTIQDTDSGAYSGAGTDTLRADTIISADGLSRTVTIGHQNDDRALANFTPYYYSLSGCGGSASGSFVTANLSSGTTRTEQSPFNAAKWGNLGTPTFDWRTKKTYIDPLTGAKILPMVTSTWTWRTDGGAAGPTSCVTAVDCRTFADWAGGSGWTNPGNIVNGATSTATTTNTNVLDLYADISGNDPVPYNYARILEDVAAVVWGKVPGCTGADCVMNMCVFLHPVAGCVGNTISVPLTSSGTIAQALSGSGDPDQPWPAAFPSSPFFGWSGSVSPIIRFENQENFGLLDAATSALAIASPTPNGSFSSALASGNRIRIAGSGCGGSSASTDLCTLTTPLPNAGGATIVENAGTLTAAAFKAYGWGIRVWKNTAVGTATIGLKYKLAGSIAPPGITDCSHVSVTSADGLTGYLCQISAFQPGSGYLAFVATDGTTRILTNRIYGVGFDPSAGNVAYQGAANGSTGWTVNKITYTGDYLTNLLPETYGCGDNLTCPSSFVGSFTTVDLMPHGSNLDLDQQITAHQGGTLPAYDFSQYGHWVQGNSNVHQFSSNGHFFFFGNNYSGQGQLNGGGPGWAAAVDISTNPSLVVGLCHTLDGTGFCPNAIGASLHSLQRFPGKDNVLFISGDPMYAANTSVLYGGPIKAPVRDIQVSDAPVVWSGSAGGATAGTCVSGALGTGTCAAGYFTGCSTLIFVCNSSLWPTANGVVYTQLLTLRFDDGGLCATSATTAEAALHPCPYNAAFGHFPVVAPGYNAYDDVGNFGQNGDSEHFRVLEVVNGGSGCGAGKTCYLVARNSVPVYCGRVGQTWQGQANPDGTGAGSQFDHANGWTLVMAAGTWDTCQFLVLLIDMTDLTHPQELGRTAAIHFAGGHGPTGINFVTESAVFYNSPFTHLQDVPETYFQFGPRGPQFQGIDASIGTCLQSYTDDSQFDSGAFGFPWALDTNPAVNGTYELLGSAACNALRTVAHITGDVYKVGAISNPGLTINSALYKQQPMIGWAGRYLLKDISGPSSLVDSTPWSMCFVLTAGECHAASSANEIYVNVPQEYDPSPGYCTNSVNWANVPCIMFGANGPAGGMRQFKINANDLASNYSRWVSNGLGRIGNQYPFTVSIAYPNGQWASQGGTQLIDGFNIGAQLISLPPWVEKQNPGTVYQMIPVKIPAGHATASVRFGYSGYSGPMASATTFQCNARVDGCVAGTNLTPYAFASEAFTETACTGGCTVNVPAVAGKQMFLQVWSAGVAVGDPWALSVP